MKYILFIAQLLVTLTILEAQQINPKTESDLEELLETTLTETPENMDAEMAVSEPDIYQENQINLNKASKSELEKLGILTDFQLVSFLEYRKSIGNLMSLNELNYIFGFNELTVKQLAPYVYLGQGNYADSVSLKKTMKNVRQEILMRSSYNTTKNNDYLGIPYALYSRYSFRIKDNFKAGFLAEKDAGEDFAKGVNRNGFDFYSGYACLQTKTFIKNISIGDYRIKAGQGLLIWNGFSSGLSSGLISSSKKGQGSFVSTNASESGYLRGASATLEYKGLSLTTSYSRKKMDATIDTMDSEVAISSLITSGYHRTQNEAMKKNNIFETIQYYRLAYHSLHFSAGINYLNVHYSLPFIKFTDPYKRYVFTGNFYQGVSAYYSILTQKFQVSGEVASNLNAIAHINGISFMPASAFIASLYYRKYPENYFSPYANSLSENSKIANEEGLFAGFQWQTDWNTKITAFADLFSVPWLSYSADSPSKGKCYYTEAVYSSDKDFRFSIRYKYSSRDKNSNSEAQPTSQIASYTRQNLKLMVQFSLSESVRLSTRVELCVAGEAKASHEQGFLASQDFIIKLTKSSHLNLCYAQYSIPDYDSRIYMYEFDVRYAFSMPAFYGNGCKTTVMLSQNLGKKTSVWLKYGYENNFDDSTKNNQELRIQLSLKI